MVMGARARPRRRVVGENPLEGEQLLLDAIFGTRPATHVDQGAGATKPKHYKVVSVSLYNEDIARLEGIVQELKRRGHYKANKSQVIRQALAQLDLDRVLKDR